MRKMDFAPVGSRAFYIKADSYRDGVLTGRLRHSRYPREIPFASFTRMVLIAEEILDTRDCPAGPELELAFQPEPAEPAALAELLIEVLFRDNHSWQGRVRTQRDGREATFRSVLELMIILDEIFGE